MSLLTWYFAVSAFAGLGAAAVAARDGSDPSEIGVVAVLSGAFWPLGLVIAAVWCLGWVLRLLFGPRQPR